VIGCQSVTTGKKSKRQLVGTLFSRSKRRNLIKVLQRLLELGDSLSNTATDESTTNNNNINMDIVKLPLLKVTAHRSNDDDASSSSSTSTSHYCFFAGVGFDSMMLQDYQDLQEWARHNRFWKNKLTSVFGYCVTLVTKTLPKCVGLIRGGRGDNVRAANNNNNNSNSKKEEDRPPYLVNIEVTTKRPESAVWIDHRRGDVVRRVTEGEDARQEQQNQSNNNDNPPVTVLYRGIAGIVAASTTPFYGGNLRLFPFARMSLDKMQLRIGRIHPLTGVMNLPGIFRGSYRDLRSHAFGCLDFMATQFTVRIVDDEDDDEATNKDNNDDNDDTEKLVATKSPTNSKTLGEGYPVQHSGESIGHCHTIDLEVLPEPIRFVTLLPPRLVYETEQDEKGYDI
jgi:hypothetical protein